MIVWWTSAAQGSAAQFIELIHRLVHLGSALMAAGSPARTGELASSAQLKTFRPDINNAEFFRFIIAAWLKALSDRRRRTIEDARWVNQEETRLA